MPSDQLQRFLFDDTAVRGEIVGLDQTLSDILENHDYPEVVKKPLGELLAACALLTATVKLEGSLSIEVRGEGPVRLLMAESNPGLEGQAQTLRGVARIDEQALADMEDTGLKSLLGEGRIVITLSPKAGKRYQGIVALDQPTIAGCMEGYFSQSEQLPTKLWLAYSKGRSAGLLIQRLPEDENKKDQDLWQDVSVLAETITEEELTKLPAQDVLLRLFHEQQPRVFEPTRIAFACTCSRGRFAKALYQLGADELREIVEDQDEIETQCHFCNTVYRFTSADVEALIGDPEAHSPTLH